MSLRSYTRKEAIALSKEEDIIHECGYALKRTMTPELYNMTSLSDVPEQWRGISWERLPDEYHKYVIIGKYFSWYDYTLPVYTCPGCQESLPYRELGWEGWPRIAYL